jgi:hypothetical protein
MFSCFNSFLNSQMQDLAKIQLDLATMENAQHWSDFSIAFIVKCAIPYCFLYAML